MHLSRTGAESARLTCAVTDDPAEVAAEWRDLLARDGSATFFSSAEWLSAWWAVHGSGSRPLFVAVRDGGRLVGLAPLLRRRLYGVPVVQFAGTGVSDYGTVLADDAVSRREVVYRVLDTVRQAVPHAVFDLREVSERDPLLDIATAWAAERGERMRSFVTAVCPFLELAPDPAAHERSLGTSVKRDERRNLRRLAELSPVDVSDDLRLGRPLDAVIAECAEVESLHPRAADRTDPWAGGGELLRRVLDADRGTGHVWLQGIRVGPTLIAYSLAFRQDRTLYGYLQAFRGDHARYGPGRLLQLHIQRTAVAAGITRFDLLRGAEPHKQGWTDLAATNHRLVMWPRRAAPFAAAGMLAARIRVSGRDELRQVAALRGLVRWVRRRGVRATAGRRTVRRTT